MDKKITQKWIIERCGRISYKRGETFFRAGKVIFQSFSEDSWKAKVIGTEDFEVSVVLKRGDYHTSCSCPSLASFQKDCQHTAAVLLSIMEHQRKSTFPEYLLNKEAEAVQPFEDLISLFKKESAPPSGSMVHFESRVRLEPVFICELVSLGDGRNVFGISIEINQTRVKKIEDFLAAVSEGRPYAWSSDIQYDPQHHFFPEEADTVIRQLISISSNRRFYKNGENRQGEDKSHLIFAPSSDWKELSIALECSGSAELRYEGHTFQSIKNMESLPLTFEVTTDPSGGFHLDIHGLKNIRMLDEYSQVLSNGRISVLDEKNYKVLKNLTELVSHAEKDKIPVSKNQMDVFLKQVVPGLRQLGEVRLPNGLSAAGEVPGLSAKLFLDRVGNRLLAGLEFHYGPIIINPMDRMDIKTLVYRNTAVEEEILQMMEESGFTETDEGFFMQNEELEYTFLYHMLPHFEKLGQVYATTAVRNRIFKDKAKPRIRVKTYKERMNWLEFTFELKGISDEEIREVLASLEEKRKYYRLRNGALLSLETKEFQEAARFIHALPKGHEEFPLRVEPLQGLKMVHGAETIVQDQSFKEWMKLLKNPAETQWEIPHEFSAVLRNYQANGFKWLKNLAHFGFGGVLADDMGLGKTIQSIAYISSELPAIRKKKQPVLIVCPSSLTYNWVSEMLHFSPDIRAAVIDGVKKEREELLKNIDEWDALITSYPLLIKDLNLYEKQTFHTIFFDEAQAFKNPSTQTARGVKKLRGDHKFALTGTPIENSLEELWAIYHVIFPELFNSIDEYGNLTKKAISERIQPFMLRRVKEDVLAELPKKIESLSFVGLSPPQKKLYSAYLAKLRHDTLKHLDKETLRKNRIKILAGITRLRQICCHPALFVEGYKEGSSKLRQLMQILSEAKSSGRRVLVFSQFTKMLEIISRELAVKGSMNWFYLHGATPSQERLQLCQRFNDGEGDVFLISLKAGGTGLNLTGADTVILYDTWWNPAVEEQAADRAHRMGQTKSVEIIKLIAKGTIEERINDLQDKKRELIDEVISTGKKSDFLITEQDLHDLLT
ncbi:DEAD/DEAH box helicase [Peribacillus kribbensis]|uniref:DEAD/DEAH box helicase n=1 Tax=Peribacillus kribbensis TaxID=356658 RepID=UPI0004132FAA|nr:DEAD/DEAH box helicase [Peribacillus kribbensis]